MLAAADLAVSAADDKRDRHQDDVRRRREEQLAYAPRTLVETQAGRLIGNRLALIGAIWYLLEWVVIFGFASTMRPEVTKTSELIAYYSSNARNLIIAAALFTLIEPGRIAFLAGLRSALRQTERVIGLADLALGLMVMSVVVEIARYALDAAAGRMATAGGNASGVLSLVYAGDALELLIPPAVALSMFVAALAQLRSRQFPAWLWVPGLLLAAAGIVGSTIAAANVENNSQAGVLGAWILGLWIWMLATGVILFRRA